MDVEFQIEDCWKYHDGENAQINDYAREVARRIENRLGYNKKFCDCDVNYKVSLIAERVQTTKCKIIEGCPHFDEKLIQSCGYVERNFL